MAVEPTEPAKSDTAPKLSPEPTTSPTPVATAPAKPGPTRKAPSAASAPKVSTAKPAATKARAATRTVADEAKKAGKQASATVRKEASGLKAKASDKAHALADQGKAAATERLDGFSKLIDDAASQVDERLGAQYGDYARSAANMVSGLAANLRGKEVDDLVADARDFVKKSPVIAIGAAAAVGFVLARLVKSGLDSADRAADGPNRKPRA